jgi:large subunit ribosomal protein L17
MRHGMANRKLGRTSAHRRAMFRNQLASMIQSERIVTTLIKAKELRPLIERMVTLGKDDSVHARRQAARSLSSEDTVKKLFTVISPRFNDRPGGYTRIVKLGPRRGDGAEMAILEFVDYKLESEKTQPAAKRGGRKKAEAAADEEKASKSRGKKAAAAPENEGGDEEPKKRAPRKKKEA